MCDRHSHSLPSAPTRETHRPPWTGSTSTRIRSRSRPAAAVDDVPEDRFLHLAGEVPQQGRGENRTDRKIHPEPPVDLSDQPGRGDAVCTELEEMAVRCDPRDPQNSRPQPAD